MSAQSETFQFLTKSSKVENAGSAARNYKFGHDSRSSKFEQMMYNAQRFIRVTE